MDSLGFGNTHPSLHNHANVNFSSSSSPSFTDNATLISMNNGNTNHHANNHTNNQSRPPPGLGSFGTNNNNMSNNHLLHQSLGNTNGSGSDSSLLFSSSTVNSHTIGTNATGNYYSNNNNKNYYHTNGTNFINSNNNPGNAMNNGTGLFSSPVNTNNFLAPGYSNQSADPLGSDFSSLLSNSNGKGYGGNNNNNNMLSDWNSNNGSNSNNNDTIFFQNYSDVSTTNTITTTSAVNGRGIVTTTKMNNDHNYSIPPGGGQDYTPQYPSNIIMNTSTNNRNKFSTKFSSPNNNQNNNTVGNFSYPDTSNTNYSYNSNNNNHNNYRSMNNFNPNGINNVNTNIHTGNSNYFPPSSNFSSSVPFTPHNNNNNNNNNVSSHIQRSPVKMQPVHHNNNATHTNNHSNNGNNNNSNTVPDVPAGLVAAPDVQARFCAIQWQLLRLLVLRRYSLYMKNDTLNNMNENNLRAAATYFEIPTHLCSLVSRPRQRINPQIAFGSNLALASIRGFSILGNHNNNSNNNSNYIGEMEWCDLSHPFVPVSSIHLSNLPVQSLTEEALGWYPTDGQNLSSKSGSTNKDNDSTNNSSIGKESSLFSTLNENTVDSTESPDARENAANAVATFAAELVSMRRFKTKLCHSWLRTGGKCPRGNTCDYAHGAEELRGALEPHKSGKYKQRVCGVWLDTAGNFCPQADRCSFAHGVHELRIRLASDASGTQDPDHLNDNTNPSDDISVHLATLGAPTVGMPGHPAINLLITSPTKVTGNDLLNKSGNSEAARYKPSLCLPWLIGTGQAALKAVLSTEMALAAGQEKQAQTYMENVRTAGTRSCSSGTQCPFAHGLTEARLPTPHELSRQISSLFMEGSVMNSNNFNSQNPNDLADALGSLQISSSGPSTNTLSPRDHLLIFLASGLITGSLPPVLFNRIRDISASNTSSTSPSSSGISSPTASVPYSDHSSSGSNRSSSTSAASAYFGDNIASDVQHALLYAARSPLLRVIIPALSGRTDNNSSTNNINNNNRMMTSSMSRIVTVVGHDAADIAIIGAAIALNLIPVQVPLPLVHGLPVNIPTLNDLSQNKVHGTNTLTANTFNTVTGTDSNSNFGPKMTGTGFISSGYALSDGNTLSISNGMNFSNDGNYFMNQSHALIMGNNNTSSNNNNGGKNNYSNPSNTAQSGRYGAFLRRHNPN